MQIIAFFFVSWATIFILLVTTFLPIACAIITILTFAFSEKSHRLRNFITYNVSAIIFMVLFSLFYTCGMILGEKESSYRFAQITPEYNIISVDYKPFKIEGKHNIDYVDSIAVADSFLFGHSGDRYFYLSLQNDSLQYDSVFSNLNLPEHYTQEDLMDAESYYSKNNTAESSSPSRWKQIRIPLLLSTIITFILSFLLKAFIGKIENIVRGIIKLFKGRKGNN